MNAPNKFHKATPIFNVKSLTASKAYYLDVLGFNINWDYKNTVCSIHRMECEVMLAEGDQGGGTAWIYTGVGDVDALYEEYKISEAIVRQVPTDFSWAREMQVEDLDGNVIRFGSDPKEDVQYGPWLDMNGKEWTMK